MGEAGHHLVWGPAANGQVAKSAIKPAGRHFIFAKANSYTNILIAFENKHARTRNEKVRGHRSFGPRGPSPQRAAACGDGRIKDLCRSARRAGVVAETSWGSHLGSRNRAFLRGEPDARARSHPEIIGRRSSGDISPIRHLRLAHSDRAAAGADHYSECAPRHHL